MSDRLVSDLELRDLAGAFPDSWAAFAYGSGALAQATAPKESPVLDLLFLCEDSALWHAQNLRAHPEHYASLPKLLGAEHVAWAQETFGAKLWFHPNVRVRGGAHQALKYGVMSRAAALRDLTDWESLYLAGRMQKPVLRIGERRRSLAPGTAEHFHKSVA